MVRGTLVFNRGLTDARFSVNWNGPQSKNAAFAKLVADLKPRANPAEAPLRTDPASVQKYQEEKLAEANRQAAQLDASPTSRRGWDWSSMFPGLIAALGAAVLIVAVIIRRRSS